MPREQVTVEGEATSNSKPRWARVKWYKKTSGEGGWTIHLGIFHDALGQAAAAMKLKPDEADDLADALKEYAAKAREAFVAAHSK